MSDGSCGCETNADCAGTTYATGLLTGATVCDGWCEEDYDAELPCAGRERCNI